MNAALLLWAALAVGQAEPPVRIPSEKPAAENSDPAAKADEPLPFTLDDLAAGPVLPPPPLRGRRLVKPVTVDQRSGVPGQKAARFLNRVEIAPVVADAGDDVALLHRLGDALSGLDVQRQRLFDEKRQPARDHSPFRLAVGEWRNADIDRIDIGVVEQGIGTVESLGAEPGRGLHRTVEIGVGEAGHV